MNLQGKKLGKLVVVSTQTERWENEIINAFEFMKTENS